MKAPSAEHPSGIEQTQITGHLNFWRGGIIEYAWAADLKSTNALEGLKKARWHLDREIQRLEKR